MINWGRLAVVTFDGSTVPHIQDVNVGDAADELTAEARDLDYKVHGQGAKDFSLEFDCLMRRTDGAAIEKVKTAYDNNDETKVVTVRRKTGGEGHTFVGVVIRCQPTYPQGSSGMYSVRIVPCDPDNLPTRLAAS